MKTFASRSHGQILAYVAVAVAVTFLCILLWSRPSADHRALVVWTAFKDSEIAVLRRASDAFEQTEHVPVRILRVPFQELQPKVQVSVPVGQGPDLVTGPHDWIGTFVQAALLRPVRFRPAELDAYVPVALDAMRHDGELVGLPISVSVLGLVTNRALCEPPKTFTELIETARALTKNGKYGFLFDDTDLYFAWPFFAGEGAYLFARTPNGLDPLRLGLDSDEAVKAARMIADFHQRWHLIPDGTNKNSANAAFLRGECAMTITGPWSLQDYRDRKIDYVFTPIPMLDDGRVPRPLVGVDGVMLTSSARDVALASRLMMALTSKASTVGLNLSAGRVPARLDAQTDPRVAQNPDVAAIERAVELGTPMPSIPAVQQVWQPMADALVLITSGQVQPAPALHEAAQRVLRNIRRSMD